jgi:hypothetical protein
MLKENDDPRACLPARRPRKSLTRRISRLENHGRRRYVGAVNLSPQLGAKSTLLRSVGRKRIYSLVVSRVSRLS